MDNADHIERTIKKTFEDVVETGFDVERIQAILHRTELSLKKQVKEPGIQVRFLLHGRDRDPPGPEVSLILEFHRYNFDIFFRSTISG